MGSSISKALHTDLPALAKLVNNAYRGEPAKKGWTHEADLIQGDFRTDEQSLKELMEQPGTVILKCEENQHLLGCVYLKKNEKTLYLGMLSVQPELQARGVGRQLMQAAETHARNVHCSRIELTVISVRKELIAWYERNGYRVTDERRPFHNDGRFGIPVRPIEFLVMEKILGAQEGRNNQ